MARLCVPGVFPGPRFLGGCLWRVSAEGAWQMDAWLLKFIGENWMTLYLTLTLLKGIALLTPSVKDDQIVTLLSNAYGVLRKGRAPDEAPK